MIRKQHGSIVWYEFELLQPFPFLRHGCFTRLSSLNVAFSSGESPSTTKENRRLITAALFEDSPGSLLGVHLVHGADVAIISSSVAPSGTFDAMATSLPQIALLTQHADCQACLLFDPRHRVIANVHAGWRGSVQNIYATTIERLHKEWGTRKQELIACISPSLGPCHAEFKNWEEELPACFTPFQQNGHFFDFWEISRHQLLTCGLAPSHIEIAGLCTYCHPDLFFSYRRDKTAQRNATCIALRD